MSPQPNCRFCLDNNLLSDTPIAENADFYVLRMLDETRKHGRMVVLKRHAETPFDILPEEWPSLTAMINAAKADLDHFNPDGYTVGWNVGAAAGQHVFHVHLHVIARFSGDADEGIGLNGLIKNAASNAPPAKL